MRSSVQSHDKHVITCCTVVYGRIGQVSGKTIVVTFARTCPAVQCDLCDHGTLPADADIVFQSLKRGSLGLTVHRCFLGMDRAWSLSAGFANEVTFLWDYVLSYCCPLSYKHSCLQLLLIKSRLETLVSANQKPFRTASRNHTTV